MGVWWWGQETGGGGGLQMAGWCSDADGGAPPRPCPQPRPRPPPQLLLRRDRRGFGPALHVLPRRSPAPLLDPEGEKSPTPQGLRGADPGIICARSRWHGGMTGLFSQQTLQSRRASFLRDKQRQLQNAAAGPAVQPVVGCGGPASCLVSQGDLQ